MAASFWQRWLNRLRNGVRTPSRRGARPGSKRAILQVEVLEDRTVPSTITYATAGSTSTLGNSTSTFNSLPTGTAAITTSTSSNPIDLSAAAFPNGFGTGDGIPGWYTADLGTTAPLTKMAEGAPNATTGALWDFNNGSAGSQALGTISTGSVNSRFGAIIENTTGGTLTQFTLSYTGEEWWEGTSAANTQALNFDYGVFSTLPTFPTAASPSGYAADTNLTFNPPKNGTQGALDGTLAANQVTNIHDTVTGLNWANDTYLVIYWQTANTGSGDGMGVHNVSFSATVAVTAPAVNTPTFAAITSNSATLGGNVAADGGSPVTERGVVYALMSADPNPKINDGTAIKVDASGTTGMFTVPVTGLSASSSYNFEAFATNSVGTTYTAATTFTTAAPGVITSWTFPTTAAAPDNSPAPTYGTGTLTTLGMTNNYNGGNTASDDIDSTSGTENPSFTENTLRVRGAQTPTGNNGWATAAAGAPEYSQGIELDTSTVGYSNIVFSFDWYSTTQGIRDLQVQYNTGSGWVNYQGPSPTGTFVTGGNDYYNSLLSPVTPTIRIDLSSVAAANNNPDLGIRLVSAFDSTGTLVNSMGVPDEYASAASPPGNIIPYNNSSGNWRFGNLTFAAGITTTTKETANPPSGQSPGQNVTFTAMVTPASGAQYASGTVAFYDGSNQIGTTQTVAQVGSTNVGTASIIISNLAPGVHGDITAQYTPASGNGLIASGSSMNLVAGDPTDNPISYTINAPQATGVDVSPVVNQPFTGVVATFSDGTYTDPTGFSAQITWASGQTTNGTIAFLGTNHQTNINNQVVAVSLFSVTGTYTYTTAGTYPISVTITDPNSNTATVNPTARVAYPPLVVTDVATINTTFGTTLTNQTVATFTDPGLVANLTALGISDPTTQFSATINWGDGTTPDTGAITYNAGTFSVVGSHSYAQANSYSISVAVTPLTVSVERIDSSDPNHLNIVGDEAADLNGLTDSPSPDFIDQFVTDPGNSSLQSSLYTFSLPTVATTGGNEALTNSSYSVSEGELTLSTNGEYLVTAGYNATVSAWAPQQTFSPASVINRVIGTINGAGVINTTTDLTDAYSGDNFRGVVSTDGTQFWTSGHAGDGASDYVHYATLGATTSTIITGPNITPYNPENINQVEIFNGQLFEGVRSAGGATAPAGIYAIGTGLPTTAGQTETLLIEVPQSNPLDLTASDKPMDPFSFYMANISDGNPTDPISGENVAYLADGEMGIARYDFSQTNGETSPQWNFSYYVDSTGSFKDSVYTVGSDGTITPTASFDSTNPPASPDPNADSSKAGGVKGLTGRVVTVNGVQEVQLFATTAFGTGSQPNPGESVIEVTDPASGNGGTSSFTTLATDPSSSKSELTGVAFTPTQTVTSGAQVSKASPTVVTTASPAVTLGTTAPTLSDSAVFAGSFNATGSLVFTLTGPNGFSYTQSDSVTGTGNATYTASDTLPTTGTVAGTYTWHVSYAGDANNNNAADQGGTSEQTVVSPANPSITTTASPAVTLGTTAPTLSDSAVLAFGYHETGSLVFTLTGPNSFSYTQTVGISGNGTYTASDTLPTTGTVAGTYTWHVSYAGDANNNSTTDSQSLGQLGDVFYIDMENHNLVQPTGLTGSPEQLLNNPAAPYLNSLMTPGNANAAQTSYASNYQNVGTGIHPSEPNYIWQEGGSNFGVVGNDDDPYANNGNANPNLNNNVKLIAATGNNPANLSGLLQAAGISWKSYQEDIDLADGGSVNQPGANALTSTVAAQSQWTVPTTSFSGTSTAYTNAYNGSDQYNFAVKHDGQLFYTDTNGGTLSAANFSPSNPEAQHYAPLQQLQTDLTNNTVGRYNLITPDQYNDMHSSLNTNFTYNGVTYTHNTDQEAVALGDNFLSQIVPQIEASQAYKNNGAIVIWYDETEGGDTSAYTVPEIIISPLANGNAYNSTQVYTHSSDLKSLQELFGVSGANGGFLAGASTAGTNDLSALFKPEQTVVSKASPTITTTASAAVTLGTTAPTLSDSAVLAAGYYETGSLVFTLSGPGGFSYTQSDTVTGTGNATYTASDTLPTTGTVAGTYTWHVSYAGDANNNSAQDQGGTTEQTVVSPANPTIMASPGATAVVGTCAEGGLIPMRLTDSATIAGGYLPDALTSSITFTLYSPSNTVVDTESATVSGNGTYTTPNGYLPTSAGTYQWVASYGGDSNNNGVSTTKGSTPEVAVGTGATVVGNVLYLVGGNTTNDQLNITPIGTSQTGSTGINVNGQLNQVNLNNKTYTQAFTTLYVVGYSGNDNFQFAGSLTIATVICAGDGNDNLQLDNGNNTVAVGNGNDSIQPGGGGPRGGNGNNTIMAGNGNDQVQLGNGNNTVTVSNGNDNVQLGNGNNKVKAGTGNDTIKAGDGANTVAAGALGSTGNIQVQLGNGLNGAQDNVTLLGNGNDQVQVGDGNSVIVSITGNGNDEVQVGNGNGDSVSASGNGNDNIQVGNGTGDFVSMVGNGNDNIQTGTGTGQVHVAGTGNKHVRLGSRGWTQI